MGLYAGLKSIFTNPYSFSLNSHFLWVCPPGLPHMSVLSFSADTGLGFLAPPAALGWTSPGSSSLLFLSTTEPQNPLGQFIHLANGSKISFSSQNFPPLTQRSA